MQISNFSVGKWKAQARVHDAGNGKLMAVISATDESGVGVGSRHTLVFERNDQHSCMDQTAALMRRLLQNRYGV